MLDVPRRLTSRIFSSGLKAITLWEICSALSVSGTLKIIPSEVLEGAGTWVASSYMRSFTSSWLSATYWVARFSQGVLTTMKLALLLIRTWSWLLASIPAWVCIASASAATGIVARARPPRGRITTLMSVGGSGSSGTIRLWGFF